MYRRDDRRSLGFALLAGPLVWAGQFMLIYGLQATGCAARLPLLHVALHAVSMLAVGVVAWAGLTSWRYLQALDSAEHTLATGGQLAGCMALSGVLVSALFLLLIILSDIPVFVLRTCS